MKIELTPNQQSALFSLNGFWSQIRDYLPAAIRRAGLTSIVKITESSVYFKDGDDRWRVRTDNKQVTKLDKDQIAMIDWDEK